MRFPLAAGLTIRTEKLEEFRYRPNRHASGLLGTESLCCTYLADAELRMEEITPTFIQSLARLEPHGIGNPAPLFFLREVPLRSVQVLKEKHLKLFLGTSKKTIEAVWWQAAQHQA